jgi:hypothetical protein
MPDAWAEAANDTDPVSGGVGGDFHDEIGVKGRGNPFQQWNGGDYAAGFQP